ncbi:MAG: hypothetical protein QOJ26_2 [Thermoplasmata archaeon]|nr:hypothetical protein [Thermoplasmata archaeon]
MAARPSRADRSDRTEGDEDPRIDALERRVAALEQRVVRAEGAALAATPRWQAVDPRTPLTPLAPMAPLAPLPPMSRPAPPPAVARSIESMLGANWLARAGILLLGLGVVFFLRLAYDRGWVPIPGRYAIGLLGGLALWVVGDALRGRRLDPAFAQVVAGGGAVILYITLYCGYAIPEYRDALGMSLPLTIGLLAAASVLLGGYALWRDLPLLGGAAAGLATILLAPAGDFSLAGVLAATFLDTGLMLAAVWRRWPPVVFTAIIAANVPILAGFGQDYQWAVLLLCAAVANGAGIAASAASRGDRTFANVQAALALAFLAAATAAGFDAAGLDRGFGWAALIVGVAGLALAFAFRRVGPGLGATAAVLLLMWPVAQFEDSLWTPLAHGVLALLAVALGAGLPRVRPGTIATSVAGSAFGLLGFWALGTIKELPDSDIALAVATGAVLTAAGLGTWLALRPYTEVGRVGLAAGLLAILLTLSTVLTGWIVTVSWAVVAVAAVVAGLSPQVSELRLAAFGIFGFVLVRIFFVDLAGLGVVGRVVAFLVTGALLLVAAFLYARGRPKAPNVAPASPLAR